MFSTRTALLNAVVERFAHRERENWDTLARANPATAHDIARALAAFAQESVGRNRTLTLARYAILVEAGTDPALREQLLATGAGVGEWFGDWLRAAGSADPGRDAPIVMNHWTGVVLHELAVPDPGFDPYTQFAVLIEGLVAGHAVR